jgi:hypothetical protein
VVIPDVEAGLQRGTLVMPSSERSLPVLVAVITVAGFRLVKKAAGSMTTAGMLAQRAAYARSDEARQNNRRRSEEKLRI